MELRPEAIKTRTIGGDIPSDCPGFNSYRVPRCKEHSVGNLLGYLNDYSYPPQSAAPRSYRRGNSVRCLATP
jgi:hypothetical protein